MEATKEPVSVALLKRAMRYGLARATSSFISYPCESLILLSQIHDRRTNLPRLAHKPETSLSSEREAFEQYLFPGAGTASSIQKAPSPEIEDLPASYFNNQNESLAVQIVRLQGLSGLWQGVGAWNVKKILNDLLEEALNIPGTNGRLWKEIISAIILTPFDNAHCMLAVQSPFRDQMSFSNGLWSVLKATRIGNLLSGVWWAILERLSNTLGASMIAHYGFQLVDRTTIIPNYRLLSLAYFGVNWAAMNIPLMVSIPLETLRRRRAVRGVMRVTRVPVADSPQTLSQQLADWRNLFHGLTYRVTLNTVYLLINLMTELESEWLPGSDGEDF